MEHLENDMDDLFQKAGELYPLKTTGSDWDAVAGKLQNENPGEVHDLSGPTAVRTRNNRKWLLLLLLIPLGLGISYYSGKINPEHLNTLSSKPQSTSLDQNKINTVVPNKRPATVVLTDHNKTAASDNIRNPSGNKNTADNGSTNGTQSFKSKRLAYVAGGKQVTTNNSLNSQKQISSTAAGKTKSDLNSNSATKGSDETEAVIVNKSTDNSSSSGAEAAHKAEASSVPLVVSAQNETATARNNTDKTDLSKKVSQDSSVAKKKTNTDSKQSKGFYVGFIIGPDISSVDFQAVKHPGYSLGATLGYRFNKKLAVETGFLYDKKYYYSDGSHYKNQSAMNTIIDVDGNCDMFEIPLTLRYDFSFNKKGNYFVKGGFSSYLMRKQTYSGNSYNNSSGYDTSWGPNSNYPQENYFLSIVQLSGGYEFSISGKTKIQIEPYVKIPLKGIGSGSMPISSAGIYFGITHSFR
jgi:Outer membrane protein beta-barrel domain